MFQFLAKTQAGCRRSFPRPLLHRIATLAISAVAALVAQATYTQSVNADQASRPNIVFIFADDQSFETIGAFGKTDVQTPNLDRLVRQGTTFTHCYNQGSWSGAVCVASRTMLVTGRFLWNAHSVYNTTEQERKDGRFWPVYMQQAGYDTYFSGKWHIRASADKAFQFASHVRPGMPNQTAQGYNRPLADQPDSWKPWDRSFGGFWKGGKHWSEVLADDGVAYLQQAAERKRPFFMYLAFNAPHDPRQSPKEFVEKYPLKEVRLPENFLPQYPDKDAIGCSKGLRDEKLGPFPRTEHAVKVHRQEYYAIISHMDAQIGRMLEALQATGKADNTYIIFTADHGLAVGHHGLMGKQNMYDHSVRVPLLVVGPDVPAGKQIDAPVYLQDVMPTTLELAGVSRPEHVQFNSLLPLIRGQGESAYDAIYGAYLQLQRMVTLGDHKLIVYPKIGAVKLFNLSDDPLETRNLAEEPQHRKTVEKLLENLLELQQETGDKLDLKQTYAEWLQDA